MSRPRSAARPAVVRTNPAVRAAALAVVAALALALLLLAAVLAAGP